MFEHRKYLPMIIGAIGFTVSLIIGTVLGATGTIPLGALTFNCTNGCSVYYGSTKLTIKPQSARLPTPKTAKSIDCLNGCIVNYGGSQGHVYFANSFVYWPIILPKNRAGAR